MAGLAVAGSGVLTSATATAAPFRSAQLAMGISDPDLLGEASALQKTQLADMKNNLHISTIRIDANWEYVQYGGSTSYDWSLYDTLVSNIRAAGLAIDFIIDGTASWASASGAINATPSSPAQFATFAQAVAKRYGSGGTTSYEIGNEPNNAKFWASPNPAAYTQVLIAAYPAIKTVQPRESVISAGLAPETNDGIDINPVTFLQAMYADGARNYMDAVGYHPYSYPALPGTYESWSGWSQLSATAPSIRSVMVANGDSAKQVWLTEVGWPTDVASTTNVTGLTAQANELQQLVAFAKSTSWIGQVDWYSYLDEGVSTSDVEDNFGLITASGTHKPAYSAMANR